MTVAIAGLSSAEAAKYRRVKAEKEKTEAVADHEIMVSPSHPGTPYIRRALRMLGVVEAKEGEEPVTTVESITLLGRGRAVASVCIPCN